MFDPYHKWLGIRKEEQPPTHFRLLGLDLFEDDVEVIEEAALRQTAHVRSYQIGEHARECTRILNEIAQAKSTLLNPAKRKAYRNSLAIRNTTQGESENAAKRKSRTASAPPLVTTNNHLSTQGRSRLSPALVIGLGVGVGVLVAGVAVGIGLSMRGPATPPANPPASPPPVVAQVKEKKIVAAPDPIREPNKDPIKVVAKPPANPIEPPAQVKPVDPPTKPIDLPPPVEPAETPVKPIEPPVKTVEPPVKPVEPPVKPVELPVKPVPPPAKAIEVPPRVVGAVEEFNGRIMKIEGNKVTVKRRADKGVAEDVTLTAGPTMTVYLGEFNPLAKTVEKGDRVSAGLKSTRLTQEGAFVHVTTDRNNVIVEIVVVERKKKS